MRNLKRVLSLALACVMVIGMMVMTTGAADFVDADKIEYTEAVDVMAALGVLEGYNGTFNPTGELTRDQAAKIICYMLMGGENADKLVGTGMFKDVPADLWSAGYVEYCANLEIVSGWNGNFAPGDKLSVVQFGKMLLCALGYDAEIEGYNNDNWATNIAADMVEVGLDVKGVSLSSATVTREQAAQMAFQALTKPMVRYTGGVEVTTGETTVTVGASRGIRSNYDSSYKLADYNGAGILQTSNDDVMQLCEELFPELMYDTTGIADSFLRPADHKWFVDNNGSRGYNATLDTVAHNAMKPATYTATVTALTAAAADPSDAADLAVDVNKVLGLKGTDALTNTSAVVSINGTNTIGMTGARLLAGDEIEVYVDINNAITNVVVTRYTLVKIANITDLTAGEIAILSGTDIGSTVKIDLAVAGGATPTIKDSRFEGFDYAKNDYVLAALKDGNTDILASKPAVIVSGKVDATKGSTYRLGDTFYSVATNKIGTVNNPAIGTQGSWALDVNGALASVVTQASTASANYAYIYRIVANEGGTDADGYSTAGTYTVYVVLADGTKASYPLATVKGSTQTGNVYIKGMKPATEKAAASEDAVGFVYADATNNNIEDGTIKQVVAYKISNGKFEVTTAANAIYTATETVNKDDAAIVASQNSNPYYCNDDTQFIFAKEGTNKMTITTGTGYKTIAFSGKSVQFVVDAQTKAVLYAFVEDSNAFAVSSDKIVAVLMDATPVVTGTGSNTTYTYSIVVDGAATTLALNSDNKDILASKSLSAGDVFSYSFANGVLSATKETTSKNIAYVNGDQVVLSDNAIVDLSTVEIFTVSYDKKTVSVGGTLVATSGKDGNTVICVNVDSTGGYEILFIMNEVNPLA